jgi:hypothetical protein
VELLANGAHKFTAQLVSAGNKRACQVEKIRPVPGQGRISEGVDGDG